ncbi:related to phosphoglycerate mutase [Ramularia collo-cygni]|uniref:Related to phosphoglycerate mutase n=1 Tax=Ramularia collo-cygni TaxID=112498 RepID=A0A2D3V6Y8_9PEZI|nr:related to phosphoglycerate mutase [Ramularia collo-cygni]CZT17259.1 related to phosphoglycerate mutase [Ramularia collo-cygni]
MELYLIRHGETVDNVAGLYAGVRDSTLTNHGVEQARRLGDHFGKGEARVAFDHIFASPLSRAYKTAQALQTAQLASGKETQRRLGDHTETTDTVEIVRVSELIEQDFGFYEGKSFQARTDPTKSGKDAHREKHKDDPGFVDVESKESLNGRADAFLDQHLLPLLDIGDGSRRGAIAVVSHGILLSHLWRRLLLRLPPKSVTVAPDIIASKGSIVLQHLGGWSNTGYLQLLLTPNGDDMVENSRSSPAPSALRDAIPEYQNEAEMESSAAVGASSKEISSTPLMLHGWSTLIVAIDRKDHLVGLKRQRGGIGRSAHDEGQQKLTGFFKRNRTS